MGKLIDLEVPCFFNPREVDSIVDTAHIGQDDICVFQEYVEALEKTVIKKKKHV